MTTELHDYLMKCVLEELEQNSDPNGVEELCSCRLGLVDRTIATTNNNVIGE